MMKTEMSESDPPYWALISILFSSFPLQPSCAMTLYDVACDLYRREDTASPVGGDFAQGMVKNLKREVVFGSIIGPAFEASLETERGAGMVRFILTREGLHWMSKKAAAPPLPN